MPNISDGKYNTRSKIKYKHLTANNVKFQNSFFGYYSKLWSSLENKYKCITDMDEYKSLLSKKYKTCKI